jgi:hypothetical protein
MPELLLNMTLVDLGSRGQAGAQRMPGEFLPPVRTALGFLPGAGGSDAEAAR